MAVSKIVLTCWKKMTCNIRSSRIEITVVFVVVGAASYKRAQSQIKRLVILVSASLKPKSQKQ